MFTLRPTKDFKIQYGQAMRELGYFPFYALARCFLAFLQNRKSGVNLFRAYLKKAPVFDKNIQKYVRQYQIMRLKNVVKHWVQS
jgi:hypothetical protein